ncbi:MAG: 30S ribosomal protein S6 [Planctomycetia bacterium]|nr:30S ribosomal protein S6 [Planctomycetia bacterium]
MPANVYECMFLLDTGKVAGDIPTAAKQLHTILERHQAEILASRPWDERRLSYPMGTHKKGLYYLTYFRSEGKSLQGIEQDVALSEMIIRALTIKIDPKMVDTMLALARDEHAVALHNVQDEPAAEEGARPERTDDRPPRRGPRRGDEDKE